jgi:hypothetical protein
MFPISVVHRGLKLLALAAALSGAIAAGPPLTTIQDTLYKADGSPFNGTVYLEWKSFQASDSSSILTQRLTVAIVNGILRVQLVPTTNAAPPATYAARYSIGGRTQFEETWSVPPSAVTLQLKDVRVTQSAALFAPAAQIGAVIQQSDVAGLPGDLSIRPVKGAGYVPSRIAFINVAGEIEAAPAVSGECLRGDGTAVACPPRFVDMETPSGVVDGSNRSFSLAQAPEPVTSLSLFRNGLLLKQGLDYVLSGSTVVFTAAAAPQPGDVLTANYRLP